MTFYTYLKRLSASRRVRLHSTKGFTSYYLNFSIVYRQLISTFVQIIRDLRKEVQTPKQRKNLHFPKYKYLSKTGIFYINQVSPPFNSSSEPSQLYGHDDIDMDEIFYEIETPYKDKVNDLIVALNMYGE